jgi:hypothetical protein
VELIATTRDKKPWGKPPMSMSFQASWAGGGGGRRRRELHLSLNIQSWESGGDREVGEQAPGAAAHELPGKQELAPGRGWAGLGLCGSAGKGGWGRTLGQALVSRGFRAEAIKPRARMGQ